MGWKDVDPTTMCAFMQAARIVNGHAHDGVIRAEADKARRTFKTPGNAPRSAVPRKTAR
nr:hypothetical protein [Ottowia thiooxydans]